ncbi:hypothetical protein Q8A67_016998 [Cirrhinus molitorella]|uniref:Uncharacterized protein n=1 Tax=Cirrhinus molitorella TaxID=172907 RepID=A0AA88PDY2_9TELE|nr:hypothetical protein Q8A67_016998 [Cirrhinus molitorella]
MNRVRERAFTFAFSQREVPLLIQLEKNVSCFSSNMQNSNTRAAVTRVCSSVFICFSAVRKMLTTCGASGYTEMDRHSVDLPLSVEETRPEPVQSSVCPCPLSRGV